MFGLQSFWKWLTRVDETFGTFSFIQVSRDLRPSLVDSLSRKYIPSRTLLFHTIRPLADRYSLNTKPPCRRVKDEMGRANKVNYRCKWYIHYIEWQDLGYLYKRRLAIEVFKVTQGLNSWLIHFLTFVESKREGLLLEVKRKNRVKKK